MKVNYNQPGMSTWNQIHFVGRIPGKDPTARRAAAAAASRQLNPGNDGYVADIDSLLTHPRDDQARELLSWPCAERDCSTTGCSTKVRSVSPKKEYSFACRQLVLYDFR